jgi:hypothetical protein
MRHRRHAQERAATALLTADGNEDAPASTDPVSSRRRRSGWYSRTLLTTATTASIRARYAYRSLLHATGHSGFGGSHGPMRCRFRLTASAGVPRPFAPQRTKRKRRWRLLLLHETGSLRRVAGPAAHCSVGRQAVVRAAPRVVDTIRRDASSRLAWKGGNHRRSGRGRSFPTKGAARWPPPPRGTAASSRMELGSPRSAARPLALEGASDSAPPVAQVEGEGVLAAIRERAPPG